jgi:DNA-binding CsgD family transcriptional regulator
MLRARVEAAIGGRKTRGRWMHLADEKLEQYPRSWLVRKMKEVPAQSEPLDLSKMQAAVTSLLCEGRSTDAIAKELEISPNTVLNHLKVVYRKVKVNSRGALVAEMMRRKVT